MSRTVVDTEVESDEAGVVTGWAEVRCSHSGAVQWYTRAG